MHSYCGAMNWMVWSPHAALPPPGLMSKVWSMGRPRKLCVSFAVTEDSFDKAKSGSLAGQGSCAAHMLSRRSAPEIFRSAAFK